MAFSVQNENARNRLLANTCRRFLCWLCEEGCGTSMSCNQCKSGRYIHCGAFIKQRSPNRETPLAKETICLFLSLGPYGELEIHEANWRKRVFQGENCLKLNYRRSEYFSLNLGWVALQIDGDVRFSEGRTRR